MAYPGHLAVCSLASAQNFEGKVIYKNDYKSKVPNMTSEQFNAMTGTTEAYFIKGGNYKSILNGKLFQWQLYINKDNELYNKMSNSATIFWNDGSVRMDEVVKAEIKRDVLDVLGHRCDELV